MKELSHSESKSLIGSTDIKISTNESCYQAFLSENDQLLGVIIKNEENYRLRGLLLSKKTDSSYFSFDQHIGFSIEEDAKKWITGKMNWYLKHGINGVSTPITSDDELAFLNNFKWYGNYTGRDDLEIFGTNALLLYSLQIKYGIEDITEEAANSLVDGPDDKKIDLVYYNADLEEAVIAQGYFSTKNKKSAPSSKASDLNTAVSWLLNSDIEELPERLKSPAREIRERIREGEVRRLTLWYSHNLPESENCKEELKTAEKTVNAILTANYAQASIAVTSVEVGQSVLEDWYLGLTIPILVNDEITLTNVDGFKVTENNWECFLSTINGDHLYKLYSTHGTKLFSANVRDYLGSRKSDSNINNGIKVSATDKPENFFVYNNGITALVNNFKYIHDKKELSISGFSIVNGAQTTGALGSLSKTPSQKINIPIRYIKCDNPDIVSEIVKYNNSQNKINAPDFRSNDSVQKRLEKEFGQLNIIGYSSRRGSASDIIKRSPNIIPSIVAGQILAAFHDKPSIAYNQKSRIFEVDQLYVQFFNNQTTAQHIFFLYSLLKSIELKKQEIMNKKTGRTQTEEMLASYFRNRGSIVVFITAVANCMEEILQGQIISKFNLHYCNPTSIDDAIAIWKPIIEILSPFTSKLANGMGDGIKNESKLFSAINEFKSLVAAVKDANKSIFDNFKNNICQN